MRQQGQHRKMQRAPQSAQDSVEGPALVLVVICSWQLKHVKVTGPSDNSVGTTNWVATAGGALCVGPMVLLQAGGGLAP